MIPRLKELYTQKIVSNLCTKFAFKNKNMAPKIQKVVLNMGLGIDGNDKNKLRKVISISNKSVYKEENNRNKKDCTRQ